MLMGQQLERRILRFLREAGIEDAVMNTDEFHLRIENEPYIPLVVERQGDELYLSHYLTQNGDMFIDTEMVFTVLPEGYLRFKETAVQNPTGGESRRPVRGFAQMFSKNILNQGFATAAKVQLQGQSERREEAAGSELPEFQEQNLFDVDAFAAGSSNAPSSGTDPTWSTSPAPPSSSPPTYSPSPHPSHLPSLTSTLPAPSLKEIADEVRDADLEVVAANLGLELDRYDKHKWRDGDHIISISGPLFMDWLADQGGAGRDRSGHACSTGGVQGGCRMAVWARPVSASGPYSGSCSG